MDRESIQESLDRGARYYCGQSEQYLLELLSPFYKAKIYQAMDELKAMLPESLSEYEKVILLYLCIAQEGGYDDEIKHISRHPASPLRSRQGVCAGYAKLLALMIPYVVGCRTDIVYGYTHTRIREITQSTSTHSWNLISFSDGGVYHLDVTWDLCGGKVPGPQMAVSCRQRNAPAVEQEPLSGCFRNL